MLAEKKGLKISKIDSRNINGTTCATYEYVTPSRNDGFETSKQLLGHPAQQGSALSTELSDFHEFLVQ